MAIYTQYGRYIKAKLFKEMLTELGDTYMLLGFGNPDWDSSITDKPFGMPVASYDTNRILYTDPSSTDPEPRHYNQFYDNTVKQGYLNSSGAYNSTLDPTGSSPMNNYISNTAHLVPPFPCWWEPSKDIVFTFADDTVELLKSDYHKAYITKEDGVFLYTLHIYNDDTHTQDTHAIEFPMGDTVEDAIRRQYFAELYMRGLQKGSSRMLGFLGAVRCKVELVRDIGSDESNYSGGIDEFWYGDRYWRVEDVNDSSVDPDKVFPHHLLFSATIPPHMLCDNAEVDQHIVPRQIAIFTKKTKGGQQFLPVRDYIFNFGQIDRYELVMMNPDNNPSISEKILNFTLPAAERPNGDFKFILHDYIKGSIRDKHSSERIGYVVGF